MKNLLNTSIDQKVVFQIILKRHFQYLYIQIVKMTLDTMVSKNIFRSFQSSSFQSSLPFRRALDLNSCSKDKPNDRIVNFKNVHLRQLNVGRLLSDLYSKHKVNLLKFKETGSRKNLVLIFLDAWKNAWKNVSNV